MVTVVVRVGGVIILVFALACGSPAGTNDDFGTDDLAMSDLTSPSDGPPDDLTAAPADQGPDMLGPMPDMVPPKTLAFDVAPTYGVGRKPTAGARADFNADGALDVAVVATTDNAVSILMGKGDGTFKASASYTTGGAPVSCAAGDLNGDGKPDLVTGDSTGVSVLINNGNGTFKPPVSYATAFQGTDDRVALWDLNGDTFLDVIAKTNAAGNFYVLLGKGDGTFQTAVPYAMSGGGTQPGMVIDDFNGDSKLDVAWIYSSFFNGVTTWGMAMQVGNGNGTFSFGPGPSTVLTSTAPSNIETLDAVTSKNGNFYYGYRVNGACYVGVPAGTQVPCDSQNYVKDLQASDVDGDGKLDLVFSLAPATGSQNPPPGAVGVAYGTATANVFSAANLYRGDATSLGQVVIGDWNGDGKQDFAVASSSSNVVSVLLAAANGSYHATRYTGAGTYWIVAVGDFNKDGLLDTASTQYSVTQTGGPAHLVIALGKANGTFVAGPPMDVGMGPNGLAAADLNKDGAADLVVADFYANTVSVLLSNGDGTFQIPVPYAGGTKPCTPAIGDFNGDGNLDIAVASSQSGTQPITVLLGNGDGTFGGSMMGSMLTAQGNTELATGDFDHDGKLDLTNGPSVLMGNGDGSFKAPTTVYPDGRSLVRIADVNNDGNLDIVASISVSSPSTLVVALGNGMGGFSYTTITEATATIGAAVSDFNLDGLPDVVIGSDLPPLQIFLGIGGGAFASAAALSLQPGNFPLIAADVNNDGKPDLVTPTDVFINVTH